MSLLPWHFSHNAAFILCAPVRGLRSWCTRWQRKTMLALASTGQGTIFRFAEPNRSSSFAFLFSQRQKSCFSKLVSRFSHLLLPTSMKGSWGAGSEKVSHCLKCFWTFLLSERSLRLPAKQYRPQQQRHLQ